MEVGILEKFKNQNFSEFIIKEKIVDEYTCIYIRRVNNTRKFTWPSKYFTGKIIHLSRPCNSHSTL